MLVDLEFEHHVHAVAVRAEIFHVRARQNIGLSENNARPDATAGIRENDGVFRIAPLAF